MDEAKNPFSPGAGTPPPELAGREPILSKASVVFDRALSGRAFQGMMLVGLRGVGKTVLLKTLGDQAEAKGLLTVPIEAPEGKRIGDLVAPELRRLLLKLSAGAQIADKSRKAFVALRNFVSTFKINIGDFGVSVSPEAGVADSGDLATDLAELLEAVGDAARERSTAVVLLIDEMQYLEETDFGALITALHRVTQKSLPVVLIGAGLPQLVGLAGRAKSYAERLFEYPQLGPLNLQQVEAAVRRPLLKENCDITDAALARLFSLTEGYPFFLQAWSYHVWNEASLCPISESVVIEVEPIVLTNLDQSFFRVRFDRLTPREKDYVGMMASLGPGPHRSGDVATAMGRSMQSLAPCRSALIKKGMIYSPAHGDTAFTVPLFDQFLKRVMTP